MKKILLAFAVVAALASCSNDEVIDINRKAISFGETFVDNATRADYSSGVAVKSFKVYGTVTGNDQTAQIYNGDDVTNPSGTVGSYGAVWTCSNVQYWLPNATYNFAAIVDGSSTPTTTLPATIPFAVADGADNKDLLYATASVSTDENATPTTGVNGVGVVAFGFEHLLSKLQFTIKNGTKVGENYTYAVTGISVSGVTDKGTYTTSSKTWAKRDGAGTVTLTFGTTGDIEAGDIGAVASETRQILPVEQTLAVTITYSVKFNGTLIAEGQTFSGSLPTKTYEANKVYNVTATITGDAIDFQLGTIGGWTSNGDDIDL